METIQTGKKIFIKPTQNQSGGALGTILASIGIPLAIEAVIKWTRKGAPRVGRPKSSSKSKSCGLNHPGVPPPFIGTWEKQFGKGAPRIGKKWPRTSTRKKQSIQLLPITGASFK